jgi:hypothetical protein
LQYVEIRDSDRQAYAAAINPLNFLARSWLLEGGQFESVHARFMAQLAARGVYRAGAADASTVIDEIGEEIIAIVITAVFPAAGPFAGIIADTLWFVLKLLVSTIAKAFLTGAFGASPAEHFAQVGVWGSQATATIAAV